MTVWRAGEETPGTGVTKGANDGTSFNNSAIIIVFCRIIYILHPKLKEGCT